MRNNIINNVVRHIKSLFNEYVIAGASRYPATIFVIF